MRITRSRLIWKDYRTGASLENCVVRSWWERRATTEACTVSLAETNGGNLCCYVGSYCFFLSLRRSKPKPAFITSLTVNKVIHGAGSVHRRLFRYSISNCQKIYARIYYDLVKKLAYLDRAFSLVLNLLLFIIYD